MKVPAALRLIDVDLDGVAVDGEHPVASVRPTLFERVDLLLESGDGRLEFQLAGDCDRLAVGAGGGVHRSVAVDV